jgi:hypothetical protein
MSNAIPSFAQGNGVSIIFLDETGVPISKPQSWPSLTFSYTQPLAGCGGGLGAEDIFHGEQKKTYELSVSVNDKILDLLPYMGIQSTQTAHTNGGVYDFVSTKGESITKDDTGVTISVSSANKDNLADGSYYAIATGTNTLTLHCYNLNSTTATYTDTASYKVADIDLSSDDTQTIAELGLEISKGTGTVTLVAGDVATFRVAKSGSVVNSSVYGNTGEKIKSFRFKAICDYVTTVNEVVTGEFDFLNCKLSADSVNMVKTGEFTPTELSISLSPNSSGQTVLWNLHSSNS